MNLVFDFEIEHIFAQQLYGDIDQKEFLERFGFFQQMRSNQIGLFANEQA